MQILPGNVKYVYPYLPTFSFGRAALFNADSVPHCHVDRSSLPTGAYESMAVRIGLGKNELLVACLYVCPETQQKLNEGVLESARIINSGSLLICGDMNARHPYSPPYHRPSCVLADCSQQRRQ